MSKFESESKKNIRSLLQQEDADDYELENPREKVDFSYFGDQPSYLESKRLPPIKIYIYGNYSHFEKATAYFMLRKAGVEFSDNYREKYYDIGWFWDSRITVDKTTKKCRQQSREVRFINYFLIDTSKDFVAKSMESHFGYTFKIDPRSFNGYCIAKHNGNGTKSCFFLKCPIDADEVFHDHCYQKIINYSSETDRSTLYEVRVPIFKNIIPFTFFKTRNKGLRFTSKNRSMQIVPANAHLSNEELESIIEYCRTIGLEYGELDILRCDDTKQIYIIDVNNTAWWPPNKLGDIDRNIALNMMWNAWLEAFLPDKFVMPSFSSIFSFFLFGFFSCLLFFCLLSPFFSWLLLLVLFCLFSSFFSWLLLCLLSPFFSHFFLSFFGSGGGGGGLGLAYDWLKNFLWISFHSSLYGNS